MRDPSDPSDPSDPTDPTDPTDPSEATTPAHTPAPPRGCGRSRASGDRDRPHLVSVLGVRAPMVVTGLRDERIAAVAARQRGRISRGQLTAIDVSDNVIKGMVRRGQLHRELRAVYAVGAPVDTPLARETSALLACTPGTLLAYRTAAVLWDLMTPDPVAPVDLLIAGRETAEPAGTTVHRTRHLDPKDIRTHRSLPVTSPARTLIDLADVVPARALERALEEALVRHLVSRTGLGERLETVHGRRGATRLQALLDSEAGPTLTRSEAEERFLALIRAAELPLPLINVHIHGFEVDFFWPAERVVVEIDGYRFHGTRAAFERDRRKSAMLTAQGISVLRPTWRQLVDQPMALVATVAQTLANAVRLERHA